MSTDPIATTEAELEELRRQQALDRAEVETLRRRIAARAARIAAVLTRLQLLYRLRNAGVKGPWLVMVRADAAAREAGVDRTELRAMALVVLRKETGIPQRAVFGCDHGSTGDRPPYCGHGVSHERGLRFVKALRADHWRYMNGVHWTQTTWYEKVFRVEAQSADLTDPAAHLKVCLGDLGLLRASRSRHDAFKAYNGSGPAAEAYADDADGLYPWALHLVTG